MDDSESAQTFNAADALRSAPALPGQDEFIRRTGGYEEGLGRFFGRSHKLRKLDSALGEYARSRGRHDDALDKVLQAVHAVRTACERAVAMPDALVRLTNAVDAALKEYREPALGECFRALLKVNVMDQDWGGSRSHPSRDRDGAVTQMETATRDGYTALRRNIRELDELEPAWRARKEKILAAANAGDVRIEQLIRDTAVRGSAGCSARIEMQCRSMPISRQVNLSEG